MSFFITEDGSFYLASETGALFVTEDHHAGVLSSAGTRIYVSAAPVDDAVDTVEEFRDLFWIEIGEITDFGEFGRVFEQIEHNPVGDRQTYKLKGARDDGALGMRMARVPSDVGQAILLEAIDSDETYGFKVRFGSDELGSETLYFLGLVMGMPADLGDVNSIAEAVVSIEIDGDIIEA